MHGVLRINIILEVNAKYLSRTRFALRNSALPDAYIQTTVPFSTKGYA